MKSGSTASGKGRLCDSLKTVALASVLFAAAAAAQTPSPVTKTVSVRVWRNGAGCSYLGTPTTVPFTDIAGGDWTKVEVRAHMAYGRTTSDTPPLVSMLINGQLVGEPQMVTNRDFFLCDGRLPYTYESGKLSNYVPFGTNTLTMVPEGGSAGGEDFVELVFTIPVPTFEFAFGPNATARMLTHDYRAVGPLPPDQAGSGRPRFRFSGSVRIDGAVAARDVWFRVIDPRDSAPYGTPVAGDNADPEPKGFLSTAGCATADCRVRGDLPLRTRSAADGSVSVDLEGTDRYGGDNYQLEASFDAAFTCATAGAGGSNVCAKSGVVTTWKRIYVEVHKMFARGAFLTRNVFPGDVSIRVSDVSVFPDPPFVVRLVHAADAAGGSPNDFYHEEVTVLHLTGRRFLNQSPAPGILYLRDQNNPNVGDTVHGLYEQLENVRGIDRQYLADAVGLVATSSDFMTVDPSLVSPLFDPAFVEFAWLSDDAGFDWTDPRYGRVIPFVEHLNQGDKEMSELLARKWMRNAQRIDVWRIAAPNHQMIFLADRVHSSSNAIHRGITRVGHAFNDLWLYCGATPNSDQRAEALTHEMGHQWLVNQVYLNGQPTTIDNYPGGHCDLAFGTVQHIGIAADAAHLCEMTSGDNMWTTSESRDRRVGFHYVTVPGQQPDSEYLHIRRRAEPVPQNDNPRPRIITQ